MTRATVSIAFHYAKALPGDLEKGYVPTYEGKGQGTSPIYVPIYD